MKTLSCASSSCVRSGSRYPFAGFLLEKILLCGFIAAISTASLEAQPAPSWADEPGSTWQRYIFRDASLVGSEDFDNEFGTPALQVVLDNSTGFGSGWYGPGTLARDDNGGAFELGPDGSITVSVPFTGISGGSYAVEYFVNLVYDVESFLAPTLSVSGYSIGDGVTLENGIEESFLLSWTRATYTGTLSGVSEDTLHFIASTPGSTVNYGALVDTFEVYTRVIPEPSTYAAIFGAGVLAVAVVLRRRRQIAELS